MVRKFADLKIGKEPSFDILLLDGMNIVKRYYFIMRDFCDKKGRPTGVLYGVMNHIHSFKERWKNAKIFFLWDTKSRKRKEIDKNYKANRKHEEKNDFWEQVRELKIMLSLYDVRQYYAEGYEADDVAAKIVFEHKDKKILLDSMDNDWDQLLGPNVFVIRKNQILSREDVQKTYEYPIYCQALVKSIVGESGDNIMKSIKNFPRKLLYELVHDIGGLNDLFMKCKSDKYKSNKWCQEILAKWETVMNNFMLAGLIAVGYEIEKIDRIDDKKKLLMMLKDHDMKKLYARIENE